jgi:F-type H+-transporting ATPase subunit delta
VISRIARPYARALLDSVRGDEAAAAHGDLQRIAEAMARVPALASVAAHPGVPMEAKEQAFGEIARSLGLGPTVTRLLLLLVRNFRLGQVPSILEAYEALLDRRRGVVRALVTSAEPLEAAQRAELERTLHRLLGSEVRLDLAVDPALLGGFVVRVGSVRYDGSLDGQLRRMREQLLSAA